MRRTVLALVALSTALVSSPALAEPIVLKASSPWRVDFGEDACRLIRVFGEGREEHYLAFQQYSPSSEAGMTVAGPSFKKFESLGRTQVRFFDAQEPLRARPFTGSVEDFGTGVIFSSLSLAEGAPVPNVFDEPQQGGIEQLDVALGQKARFVELRQGPRVVRLDTGPMGEAFKVLNQCTLDLLNDWGLDAERHQTAQIMPRWTNATPLVRKIIATYPRAGLSKGEQAIMRMRVIVSAEGAVESCTILKATNTTVLESPACEVMQRATFEPARDAEGQPFRSFYATSITYQIP